MDPFFRAEGLRGVIGGLRAGNPLEEAIRDGIALYEIAVQLWNVKHEWQVHRSPDFGEDYIRGVVRSFKEIPKRTCQEDEMTIQFTQTKGAMMATELYKVWRPVGFKEVFGQDLAVTQLKSLLKRPEGLPHTISFTGPSGCGKTTLARIVADKLGCPPVTDAGGRAQDSGR